MSGRSSEVRELNAIVVGAGFAGLYSVHKLRQMGLRAQVLEAGSDIGGTWFWNRYPGARCDVESLEYSYSFSEELQQEWVWPERFAAQSDILRYINHVADRFSLRPFIQTDTRVVSAVFDREAGLWTVETASGEVFKASFCIMATGNLSLPRVPDLPGLETFKGNWHHSGLWPKDGVDFSGRRVGVIGTGSSGIQMIPVIAAQAKHLHVFQRSANFSVPAVNRPLTPEFDRRHKERYAYWRDQARQTPFGISGHPPPTKSALEATSEERDRDYETKWRSGGNISFLYAYNDLLVNAESNETASEFVRAKIRSIVRDPKAAELLQPRDHPIGTKRLCLDTSYFETFNRDNVTLVDIKSDPIVAVTPTGLRTKAQEFELDDIAFATGFDAITGALFDIDIRVARGSRLCEKWANGPRTYLGLMAAGFPNLFMVTGPQSPSVKSNMIASIEQHVDWIAGCLQHMRDHCIVQIEPDEAAENDWVDHVGKVADATLYPRANSWYVGANIPGKPRVFTPYVAGLDKYRQICDGVAADKYRGFTLTKALADEVQSQGAFVRPCQ